MNVVDFWTPLSQMLLDALVENWDVALVIILVMTVAWFLWRAVR